MFVSALTEGVVATADDQGNFVADLPPFPNTYRVWIYQGRQRLLETAEIAVERSQSVDLRVK
jgi:hypothetical protein